ncbi:MAG: GntP family permease [Planctomycetota bacterium]
MPILAIESAGAGWWPFAILAITVGVIVVSIAGLRLHAFVALVLAALTAGILAAPGSLSGVFSEAGYQPLQGDPGHCVQAVELTAQSFGVVAGRVAVVIALASVISMCLMESGAADKVVRRFLAAFGPERAGPALLVASYVISIPIFFDTFFMLLLPIAKALRLRTGKDYVLYVMAICVSGSVTHSMVAPHPGPLAMAASLRIDLGLTIAVGIFAGILPAACAWLVARWVNRRMDLPLREVDGAPLSELETIVRKPESELPGFAVSLLPILLPIGLISSASFASALGRGVLPAGLLAAVEFLGNRNVALVLGAAIALAVLRRARKLSFARMGGLMGPPLATAGVIILITSAGGAFGLMLKHAGVGAAVREAASGSAVNLVVLSYAVALVIRIAQGSATVAMLTTAEMMAPFLADGSLPYHPIYLFLAIGFGALGGSWMNDSGFWVVSRLSGFSEKETLKSWSLIVTTNSVVGFAETLLLANLLPLRIA